MQIARRYARALYEEAQRHSTTDSVNEDVDLVRETLENSRELRLFFQSPIVSREKKEAVVRELFGERVSDLTLQFLEQLIEKKRETVFPEIALAFQDLRDHELGVVRASARVATPLSEADKQHLVSALERLTGKSVRLSVEQHAELMGGLVIRVGDTVYDGSVRNQLANLREQMEAGGFTLN